MPSGAFQKVKKTASPGLFIKGLIHKPEMSFSLLLKINRTI
ncbi:hypothetical protein ENTCAN_05422 [Enterobacter cancerogenus ATCC 35316]|nr:hypothetical protein ENTCAN_05422 [Enterobacter cancerogenus ATCC 35316]